MAPPTHYKHLTYDINDPEQMALYEEECRIAEAILAFVKLRRICVRLKSNRLLSERCAGSSPLIHATKNFASQNTSSKALVSGLLAHNNYVLQGVLGPANIGTPFNRMVRKDFENIILGIHR
jgi:hypothetical protein